MTMTAPPGAGIPAGSITYESPATVVVRLDPADVWNGTSPLWLRIHDYSARLAALPTLDWINVAGIELGAHRREIGPRVVAVRKAALREALQLALRAAGALPTP